MQKKDYTEILVSKFATEDNFPLAVYGGDFVSNSLYMHGIIKNRLKVKFIPDDKLNQFYGIALTGN